MKGLNILFLLFFSFCSNLSAQDKDPNTPKEFLKGKLVLRLEDSEEYAHLLGKFQVLYNKTLTLEEILAEVDMVTAEDVQRVARDLFREDTMYLSIIGPYSDKERFRKLMKMS